MPPKRHQQCYDGLAPVSDIRKCIKHGHYVLILMRGAPGSGKSHLAEELLNYRNRENDETRNPVILSTDKYFMTPNGRYAFDPSRLDEFHKKNQAAARDAMENLQSPVIIDNTNMQLAHMKVYIAAALKESYEIYIVEPSTQWKMDARELARKNKHFVDELQIGIMLQGFEKINRFADLIKPVILEISRVELSDEESSDEGSPVLSIDTKQRPNAVSSLLPPGLFSPAANPCVQQLQQQQLSPILSMSHEPLTFVHQRDVGCQATVGIGLLAEIGHELDPSIRSLCVSVGEGVDGERTVQRRRGKGVHDVETDTPCIVPSEGTILKTAFPMVEEEDVEIYLSQLSLLEYATFLVEAKCEMDCAAPIPWMRQDLDNRSKKARPKQELQLKELPGPSKKQQTTVTTQRGRPNGVGEGCGGGATEDVSPASASLSNENSVEEKFEPFSAMFPDDEEYIAVDPQQPIQGLLDLFFARAAPTPGHMFMPMWLLRLLERAARGERITKNAVYHEDFPAIDPVFDEEIQRQEQLRADEAFARQCQIRESGILTVTDSFTNPQLQGVKVLRSKYPAANPETVAEVYKSMNFDMTTTLSMLKMEFGEPAPGPAYTLPSSVKAPPPSQPPISATSSPSRTSTNKKGSKRLPTYQQNGRITDVGRMAERNGAEWSQEKVQAEFVRLHDKREELQRQMDEVLRKSQRARDPHTRGHYGNEIRLKKDARVDVEHQIRELGEWWNEMLNSDVIDLHYLLAEQAISLLRDRIERIKANLSRGGTRKLTVITGSGNNSIGGQSEIKKRVLSLINSNRYNAHQNNAGCIVINF